MEGMAGSYWDGECTQIFELKNMPFNGEIPKNGFLEANNMCGQQALCVTNAWKMGGIMSTYNEFLCLHNE